MYNEILIEDFLMRENVIAVDVRSPMEYTDGSIPGAINLPLFTDEERTIIGTIYKKQGEKAAKWKAMEVVSPKIPIIMAELRNIEKRGVQPIIYCWRCGMRSKVVTSFMDYSGLTATRLIGGYKAYRQFTLDNIGKLIPRKAIILHGKTGVGKTKLLHQLKVKGYPVIDLEELAGHRGSIFGSMGQGEGHNQKTFDSLLFKNLLEIKDSPYIIMEAESKRIGRAVMPIELIELKLKGYHLYLETSLEQRVNNIYQEYVSPFFQEEWFKEKVQESKRIIDKRVKNMVRKNALNESFISENWRSFIQLLLEDYYDPRYDHKLSEYHGEVTKIDSENSDQAIDVIEQYIGEIVNYT